MGAAVAGSSWELRAEELARALSPRQLAEVLCFNDALAGCGTEQGLHDAIARFARFLDFEFVLYAFMHTRYLEGGEVVLKNLSNPPAWMEEYARNQYLSVDPVRFELERRLRRSESVGAFAWDAYERPLSTAEREVIAARTSYGLRTGFSAFCDAPRQDSVFLVSFATARETPPGAEALLMAQLVVPHLNRSRKRIDLTDAVRSLTRREQTVAQWLVEGKSNGEIAQILGVSLPTAKFHVANILSKLKANSRQAAVAVLVAERYVT